jgi:hypothetical protein
LDWTLQFKIRQCCSLNENEAKALSKKNCKYKYFPKRQKKKGFSFQHNCWRKQPLPEIGLSRCEDQPERRA